ncbi:MAG: HD family hydrolase [Parvularculaceae bacterium]|nr:HD family hydrolase [Parvularculaceae bacterium]
MARPRPTTTRASDPPRAWQRMLSGRRLDLLDPSPVDIEIEDIAHGLSRVARWNGQTAGDLPFTVAQHSLIVEQFCLQMKPGWPAKWRLAALLHDAPEFVIGDMISPFKAALGEHYRKIERRMQEAVHLRFGLPPHLPETIEKAIKRADKASAYFEATQLAGFETEEALRFFGPPKELGPVVLSSEPSKAVQSRYLDRFAVLCAAMANEQGGGALES